MSLFAAASQLCHCFICEGSRATRVHFIRLLANEMRCIGVRINPSTASVHTHMLLGVAPL